MRVSAFDFPPLPRKWAKPSRVTGKDADGVGRIYNTFKALCNIASFDGIQTPDVAEEKEDAPQVPVKPPVVAPRANEFHYNIQIHLPATNDISVYNAIFKSLKDNLLM